MPELAHFLRREAQFLRADDAIIFASRVVSGFTALIDTFGGEDGLFLVRKHAFPKSFWT